MDLPIVPDRIPFTQLGICSFSTFGVNDGDLVQSDSRLLVPNMPRVVTEAFGSVPDSIYGCGVCLLAPLRCL